LIALSTCIYGTPLGETSDMTGLQNRLNDLVDDSGLAWNGSNSVLDFTLSFPMPDGSYYSQQIPIDKRTWDISNPVFSWINSIRLIVRGLLSGLVGVWGIGHVLDTLRNL
tara:strand:+ start:739 stop:1068 length:330 start_codon:yes stop_codon:yes gene_type:complete